MKHDGVCYRNSNLASAVVEEHQAQKVATELLLDLDSNYVGDDQAIFCLNINADNDTRAPAAIIREQNRIIGFPANNLAEHTPDKGHVLKCNNNSLFKLRDEDKTLKGVHALTNQRIKSMNADVSKALAEYQEIGVGNTAARKACLEQIEAIVPHNCGKHEKCKHEKWCTYVQVKSKPPDWNGSQIAEEAARISTWPFNGRNMSLLEDGISVLRAKLNWRFNDRTINKCAGGGCSNLCGNFWNMNTKSSEGKRLNYDHTDSWEVTNKLSFCRKGKGNIKKTHNQVAGKLGLPVLSPEVTYQATATKRSVKCLTVQHSTKFKLRQSFAKILRNHWMGKIDAKNFTGVARFL